MADLCPRRDRSVLAAELLDRPRMIETPSDTRRRIAELEAELDAADEHWRSKLAYCHLHCSCDLEPRLIDLVDSLDTAYYLLGEGGYRRCIEREAGS